MTCMYQSCKFYHQTQGFTVHHTVCYKLSHTVLNAAKFFPLFTQVYSLSFVVYPTYVVFRIYPCSSSYTPNQKAESVFNFTFSVSFLVTGHFSTIMLLLKEAYGNEEYSAQP